VRRIPLICYMYEYASFRKLSVRCYISATTLGVELPARLADLLATLPKVIHVVFDADAQRCTSFLRALNINISSDPTSSEKAPVVDTDIPMKSFVSVRKLTIPNEVWQALAFRCPNLHSLTVVNTPTWRSPVSILALRTMGESLPNLKRLHCADICQRGVIEGKSHLNLYRDGPWN
jgi:hypothetical protein